MAQDIMASIQKTCKARKKSFMPLVKFHHTSKTLFPYIRSFPLCFYSSYFTNKKKPFQFRWHLTRLEQFYNQVMNSNKIGGVDTSLIQP
jgi:hypothetical protein